jgi:hypothetical protein
VYFLDPGASTHPPPPNPGDRRHHPLLRSSASAGRHGFSKLEAHPPASHPPVTKLLKKRRGRRPVRHVAGPAGPAPSTLLVVLLRSSPNSPTISACANSTARLFIGVPGSCWFAARPGRACAWVTVTCAPPSPIPSPSSSSPAFQRPAGRTDHSILIPLVLESPLYILRLVPRPLPSHAQAPLLLLFSSFSRLLFSIERSICSLVDLRNAGLRHRSGLTSDRQMDPWISSQPSLSLDLHVGLPPLSRHQAPVALAKPKVLLEENFLQPLKKEPEVRTRSPMA